MIVLGDFNGLADSEVAWPAGTTQVFRGPDDVMVVATSTGAGALPALHTLTADVRMSLPNEAPCRFFPDRNFSDHCGLLVRFSE